MSRSVLLATAFAFLSGSLFAEDTVTVAGGATYSYATGASGQILSVASDDGTSLTYKYDSTGIEVGVDISTANTPALTVRYAADGTGYFVWAPGLPAIKVTPDANGRTADIATHPEITISDDGEIESYAVPRWSTLPAPATVATFAYDAAGHLTQATLNGGLLLQLAAPDSAGVVHQTLFGSTGNVLAEGSAVGKDSGVRIVPAQLDAVAAEFGLGGDWADALTFQSTSDGHVTTAYDANGQAVLYMVNCGPYRVGFSTDGTALFYDIEPNYESAVEGTVEVAPELAGVAPNHIIVTASGRTGFYLDRPADGALYSAWNEVDAAGNVTQPFAVLNVPPAQSRRTQIATDGRRLIPRTNFLRHYTSQVCVNGYCWIRTWTEWIEDAPGGGSSGSGNIPPGRGGTTAAKPGNQIIGYPILRATLDRGLQTAVDKLKNSQCQALLNQPTAEAMVNPNTTGNKTLLATMQSRGYNDPSIYLTRGLTYVAGTTPKQCPGGNDTKASTTVGGSVVAICPAFGNANNHMAAVYLIHEMLHTLGLPEAPTSGAKTSGQITSEVTAACGGS